MAQQRVYKGDTAILDAYLYDEDGVTPLDATSVSWQIQKPDGTIIPGGPLTLNPAQAEVIIADNNTTDPGLYYLSAQFTLADGSKKSSELITYEVTDPFKETTASAANASDKDKAIDHAWMKLEDLFDSDIGGPWLREKTLRLFDKSKMGRLLPDALYYINNVDQPVTAFDDTSFPYQQHSALLSQALLVETIYHLIRSYAEQPNPIGQPITYFDRRDYIQRWQQILQPEEKKLQDWLSIFKFQYTGFGSSALLVGGYASSLVRTPAAYRARYPRYITPYRSMY